MAWTVEYTQVSSRQLQNLDPPVARRIENYLNQRVATLTNPRKLGRALNGPWIGYLRYRIGNYRVICQIQDEVLRIVVVRVGRRDQVYR